MPAGRSSHAALTILSVLALLWTAYVGSAFLAPLTLALFLVTLFWPIQMADNRRQRATVSVAVHVLCELA